jgi:hypothetical protein
MRKKHLALLAIGLLILFRVNAADIKVTVPADRWMEIDLYWFDLDNMDASVNLFWERYSPLMEGVAGWKGVILNIGWLMDYVTEWNGDMNEKILLPKNMKQWELFRERGQLTGTTEERMAVWRNRFPKERSYTTIIYQPWTYGDLKKLAGLLRKVAEQKYHIGGFKVGSLVIGWENAYYGEPSSFTKSHPNMYLKGVYGETGVINLEAKLTADVRKFGSYPGGIPEGTPFTVFFGKQWGSLSKATGLDAILFRDSFLGSGVYGRKGLYGLRAHEDPAKTESWTKAACDLIKQTKQSNPNSVVIGYSNAASGVADLRINCLDLETIAKDGYLDAWIDQTWAGAWNEVGQRPYTFWNSQDLGWTYQLAYVLTRAAVLADTKVRHYFLTETFDAWESWDIIHNAPERLRWGIWAYSHAAVKTPSGLKTPKGSYISWCNQGKELLSADDVKFLAGNSDEAFIDAGNMKKVNGPTLVYNRSAMEWQSKNTPNVTIKEWIDEQAGTLMKWSVPIISSTRLEYIPEVESDLFILQTPVHMNDKEKNTVISILKSGKPVAVFGSPVGGLDPEVAAIIGVSTKDKNINQVKYIGTLNYRTGGSFNGLQNSFPLYQPFSFNSFGNGLESYYSVDRSPCLGLNKSQNMKVLFWDPPELKCNVNNPYTETGDAVEELTGSPEPWVLTARLLNSMAQTDGKGYVERIEPANPVFLASWQKSDGTYMILTGNLEEGVTHTADQSRRISFIFPQEWVNRKVCDIKEIWKGKNQVTGEHKISVLLDQGETSLYSIK